MTSTLKSQLHKFEAQVLKDTLDQTKGNVRRAAKLLGISNANFYFRLNKLGIDPDGVREYHKQTDFFKEI